MHVPIKTPAIMGASLKIRYLPQNPSATVTDALTSAAVAALNSKKPLTPGERAVAALAATADVFEALARDAQDLIDRCDKANITHEDLIKRLTYGRDVQRATARMLREDEA